MRYHEEIVLFSLREAGVSPAKMLALVIAVRSLLSLFACCDGAQLASKESSASSPARIRKCNRRMRTDLLSSQPLRPDNLIPARSIRCAKKNRTTKGVVTSAVKATIAPMSGAPLS